MAVLEPRSNHAPQSFQDALPRNHWRSAIRFARQRPSAGQLADDQAAPRYRIPSPPPSARSATTQRPPVRSIAISSPPSEAGDLSDQSNGSFDGLCESSEKTRGAETPPAERTRGDRGSLLSLTFGRCSRLLTLSRRAPKRRIRTPSPFLTRAASLHACGSPDERSCGAPVARLGRSYELRDFRSTSERQPL